MGAKASWITQFAASVTPPPSCPPLLPSSSHSSPSVPRSEREEPDPAADGVQLRGHDGRGGPVPRAPPPPPPQRQHHADGRRRVVAAHHAPELLLRVLRRQRRRGQVRVRAADARRLLQVPPPPHQLAGPPAPVPAHLPRAAGPVTDACLPLLLATEHRGAKRRRSRRVRRREPISIPLVVIRMCDQTTGKVLALPFPPSSLLVSPSSAA